MSDKFSTVAETLRKYQRGRTVSDGELLAALETYIKREPLVLWYGAGEFPGGRCSGISLLSGRRTLREALRGLVLAAPPAKGGE